MLVPKLLLTPIKIRIFGPKTAKFGPKSAFLVILGQILPFLHIFSIDRPKNNANKVPRWVFRYVGNKAYDFSSKKKDFLPKNDQIWPKIGIFGQFGPGHAGLFSALLVGRLVVVARGLYLARHLFTLSSPRAKRAGPKGLRAESARAVTGRRCPQSGVGQDFWRFGRVPSRKRP